MSANSDPWTGQTPEHGSSTTCCASNAQRSMVGSGSTCILACLFGGLLGGLLLCLLRLGCCSLFFCGLFCSLGCCSLFFCGSFCGLRFFLCCSLRSLLFLLGRCPFFLLGGLC